MSNSQNPVMDTRSPRRQTWHVSARGRLIAAHVHARVMVHNGADETCQVLPVFARGWLIAAYVRARVMVHNGADETCQVTQSPW